MSWFPKFLHPEAAFIAAAAAVPALLLLYFLKLRRREMPVPSTLLWKKAIQDLQVNAPFQKLRKNLLLLLQLLLLLLLILALSRPVSNYTPGPGKTTVILIDHSASMNARDQEGGRSRLEEAKRQAKDLVASMGRDTTAMVVAFADHAHIEQAFTSDVNLLNTAIDRIQPTDHKTDLGDAYQLADAQVNFNPEQLRPNKELPDVRVFSDGRVEDTSQLSIKAKVTFEKIGSDQTGNIAIVALNAKRSYERPTQVQAFARLANFGTAPIEAPVRLSVNGETLDAQQHTLLLPERWTDDQRQTWEKAHDRQPRDSVEFKLDLTQAAVLKIEQMHRQGDALAADDSAQIVVPPPKLLSVALVTDGNYFLQRAVKSLGLKKSEILRPKQYEQQDMTPFDVIIFDNYKPNKLPEAGNFLWFGVVPDGIKTKVATIGGPTSQPASNVRPIVLEDMGVLDWKRDQPVLQDVSLAKLYVAKALKLQVPLDQQVLVDGLKGPLVVLDREPKSTHLIVAFDVLESNWPLNQSFPVFLFNAMQFLAVGSNMDVRQSVEPGTSPRIPRANLLKASPNLTSITLHGPTGAARTVAVPVTGDFLLPPLDEVGLYTTEPPIPQFEQIAVNLLDSNESNLQPGKLEEGGGTGGDAAAPRKNRLELWWWLATAALGLLLVEWWVYTRRVHL